MKLCLRAGGDAIRNPDAFLLSMPRSQFLEWEAFYQLDPWDGERDDLLAGKICSAVAASVGVDSPPKDHMPDWLNEEERRTLPTKAEHEAQMDQVFAGLKSMRADNGGNNRTPGRTD